MKKSNKEKNKYGYSVLFADGQTLPVCLPCFKNQMKRDETEIADFEAIRKPGMHCAQCFTPLNKPVGGNVTYPIF